MIAAGKTDKGPVVDIRRLDLSALVGRRLTLFSEQFGNRPLESRVIVAGDHTVTVDRGGASGLVDSLVNNQRVTVKMEYRGEQIAIQGQLKRTGARTCKIIFDDRVTLLTRRRFPRIVVARSVRLAALPRQSLVPARLDRLRWMVTETIDLSGGGTLLGLSSNLQPPAYLCLNIDFVEIEFPKLVIGQVRHCSQNEIGQFQLGVMFIPRENRAKHVANAVIKALPENLFVYDEVQRYLITNRLVTWTQNRQP